MIFNGSGVAGGGFQFNEDITVAGNIHAQKWGTNGAYGGEISADATINAVGQLTVSSDLYVGGNMAVGTKGAGSPSSGNITAAANLFLGTADGVDKSGNGAIYAGANINGSNFYAGGGPDGTALNTFDGPTRIFNGYGNGTWTTYTPTTGHPAATP